MCYNGGKLTLLLKERKHMEEQDGGYADGSQFNPALVESLREMTDYEKNECIEDMQETMAYVTNRAEEEGFLYEMITSWPRMKIAAFESAMVIEEGIRKMFGDLNDEGE